MIFYMEHAYLLLPVFIVSFYWPKLLESWTECDLFSTHWNWL